MKIIDKLKGFVDLIELDQNINNDQLEIILTELYYIGLTTTRCEESDSEITLNYDELRKTITKKFPKFGLYHLPLKINNFNENAELGTGDAIDDLTDIYKDIKESLSLNNDEHIISQFKINFDIHTKEHIINLLKYLESANE